MVCKDRCHRLQLREQDLLLMTTVVKGTPAVDDMMMYAAVGDYKRLGLPNVTYLIQARRQGKGDVSPVYGFEVYEVRQDNRTAEVMQRRISRSLWTLWTWGLAANRERGPFVISVEGFRSKLEKLDVEFVAADATRNEM